MQHNDQSSRAEKRVCTAKPGDLYDLTFPELAHCTHLKEMASTYLHYIYKIMVSLIITAIKHFSMRDKHSDGLLLREYDDICYGEKEKQNSMTKRREIICCKTRLPCGH